MAAGVDVAPGTTYTVTTNPTTIDWLDIEPTGTVQLGGNTLIDTDNGVDTTWSGLINGVVNVGTLIKNGNGTVTFSNLTATNDELHIEGGKALQTGTTNNIRYLAVGSDGNPGEFDITGGTLNISGATCPCFPAFQVGDFGGTGVVNQSAGAVNLTTAAMNIGSQGGTGTYNLTGGTITITGTSSGVSIGRDTKAAPSTGTLNISGGLFDDEGGPFVIGNLYANMTVNATQGTVNQTGGTLEIGSASDLYIGGYNKGTYNLDGGTLEIGGTSLHGAMEPSGSTFFNLGGGTIKVINSALTTTVNATLVGGTTSTIDTTNFNATWNGMLLTDGMGAGNLTKIGVNTLTLGGVNTYTGVTTIAGGTLKVVPVDGIASSSGVVLTSPTATLDVSSNNETIKDLSGVQSSTVQLGAGGTTFKFGTMDNTTFNGNFTGTGEDVTKQGTGTFTFGGTASGVGYFTISQGTLATTSANAMHGASPVVHVVVQNGATWDLTGAGQQTVGDLQVNTGATLAVTLGNNHDNLSLTAGAAVNGIISVHRGDGNFSLASEYTLISGGVINSSGSTVVDDMPLITVTEDTTVPNTLKLKFAVTGSIADLGTTANEKAVGGAINTLGNTNALYNSLVNQTQAGGQQALQQLADDFEPSFKDILAGEADFLAGSAGERLDALGASNGGGGADVTVRTRNGNNLWLQGYGQSISLADASGNAGDTNGTHYGFLTGLDGGSAGWSGGLAGGAGASDVNSASRAASGHVNSVDVLAYTGGKADGFDLRTGGSYSFDSINTTRTAIAQTLTAAYNARTAQLFGEVGADIDGLEPFVGANYINIATDAFSETGGSAAVSAGASTTNIAYTTLGLRGEVDNVAGATLHGMAGWRHTFGDVTPTSNLTIQGQGYTVAGVPLATDTFVAEAGVDFAVNPNFTIGADYTGQLSAQTQNQGGRATASLKF